MPRPGEVSVTLTEEARDLLKELKDILGTKSMSDTIVFMYDFMLSTLATLKRAPTFRKALHKHLRRYPV